MQNQLSNIIQPEAKKEDGITYEWQFGDEVPTSKINNVIFGTDASITKVDLTVPPSNVPLQPRELPVIGTMNITVVTP